MGECTLLQIAKRKKKCLHQTATLSLVPSLPITSRMCLYMDSRGSFTPLDRIRNASLTLFVSFGFLLGFLRPHSCCHRSIKQSYHIGNTTRYRHFHSSDRTPCYFLPSLYANHSFCYCCDGILYKRRPFELSRMCSHYCGCSRMHAFDVT